MFSVTKNGKPLEKEKYTWDEETRTFSTMENNLVLDFREYDNCTFNTGKKCVIVRRDIFEVIQPKENEIIKLCPYQIPGYISKRENEDVFYMDMPDGTRQEHIIADSILSKVISKKTVNGLTVYKVINHNKTKQSFLVFDGENYSHGDTFEEAKESLIYKISNRDTSEFEKYSPDDELDKATLIKMYRAITGACEAGTRYFCEKNVLPDKCTIKEAIELTKGQYNADKFEEFFKEVEG